MTLLMELDKIYYFMKRDMLSFSTYKTNILLSVLSALFGALSYAFLGANASVPSVTQIYSMPYTTYLLIGLAFNTYLSQSLTLVQRTIEAFGQVDVLINNAGIDLPGVRLAEFRPEDWERILRVNLSGPFYLIQAALPHMKRRRSGQIINISSNVTQRFPMMLGPYTVTKCGLDALTRILAKEEGPNGIRVNAIAPGPIRTDMLEASLRAMGSERAEAFIRSVPLGRMGRPEEIASVVRFLVSEGGSYITGQVIYVNGGGPGN